MQFRNLKASQFTIGELEHPNKMPFFGILTYFDVPSDKAPHGSGGRKVFISSDVGVPSLDSLIGMAVNYIKESMDGHDQQNKIGIITSATAIEPTENGTPVYIEGFIYANDFPDAALDIKQNQSALGFSYETTKTLLIDGAYEGESVAVVTHIVFTGASILYANDAAYTNTALAASAETETNNEEEVLNMDLTELMASIETMFDSKLEEFKKEIHLQASSNAESQESDETTVDTTEETQEEDNQEAETNQETELETNQETNQETELEANADLKAELEKVKVELAEIKASADLQAAARKTIAYPKTLISKYELSEEEEETKLMASIDERKDLSIEESLALKIELLERQRKQQGK